MAPRASNATAPRHAAGQTRHRTSSRSLHAPTRGFAGNPVWPIPVPPQPVLEIVGDDIEKGPARVGSFVLASLGMAFLGIASAVPEFARSEKK